MAGEYGDKLRLYTHAVVHNRIRAVGVGIGRELPGTRGAPPAIGWGARIILSGYGASALSPGKKTAYKMLGYGISA